MSAWLQSAGVTVLSFALVISVVVFFHELGHLLVGKALGVKAIRFSIGFGPRLFGTRLGETEYRVSLLPLGGYVKFAGDNPYEEVAPEDRGRGFLEQAPWKRGLIAFAGPFANFVLACIVAAFLGIAPHDDLAARVGAVAPESAAERAGLRSGDRILAIDGEPVSGWTELHDRIRQHVGEPLELQIQRGSETLNVRVVPSIREENGLLDKVKVGRLGIMPFEHQSEVAVVGPSTPAWKGGLRTFDLVTAVDGTPVKSYEQLAALLASKSGPVEADVLRPEPVPAPGATLWRRTPLHLRLPARAAAGDFGIEPTDLTIAVVQPGSPAAEAGLRRGDRVLAVEGKRVVSWTDDVEQQLVQAGTNPVLLAVRRDGEVVQVTVQQRLRRAHDQMGVRVQVPELGAQPAFAMVEPERVHLGWNLSGAGRGLRHAIDGIQAQVVGIGRILTGRIPREAIGGPLMIAVAARQAAEQGWQVFLGLVVGMSVALGVMNLIPIPVLDGFHVLSAAVEGIRRRPLSLRFREVANVVGIALLLSLMVFAFRNDFLRLSW